MIVHPFAARSNPFWITLATVAKKNKVMEISTEYYWHYWQWNINGISYIREYYWQYWNCYQGYFLWLVARGSHPCSRRIPDKPGFWSPLIWVWPTKIMGCNKNTKTLIWSTLTSDANTIEHVRSLTLANNKQFEPIKLVQYVMDTNILQLSPQTTDHFLRFCGIWFCNLVGSNIHRFGYHWILDISTMNMNNP